MSALFPVHDPIALPRLRARTARAALLPASALRAYFGDAVGFAAAFANAVLLWLLAPAVAAGYLAASTAWRWLSPAASGAGGGGGEVDADGASAALLSCFAVVWGAVGLKLWARQEAWLALRRAVGRVCATGTTWQQCLAVGERRWPFLSGESVPPPWPTPRNACRPCRWGLLPVAPGDKQDELAPGFRGARAGRVPPTRYHAPHPSAHVLGGGGSPAQRRWAREQPAAPFGCTPPLNKIPPKQKSPPQHETAGYQRRSPVTGSVELYYAPLRRAGRVALSTAATAALLVAAAALLAALLNLQGNVEARHAWLHVRALAGLRAKGGPFAPERGPPLALLPVVLRAVATWAFTDKVFG